MNKILKIIICMLIGFAALQFFRPKELVYEAPKKELGNVPKEVTAILRNSCFACHSNENKLSWYDKITPANFIVDSHIRDGRKVLNFSNWDSIEKPKQNAILYYSFNKILSGEMPLSSYTAIHTEAKLNQKDIQVLKNYLVTLAPRNSKPAPKMANPIKEEPKAVAEKTEKPLKVAPSPNGIQYIPDYRGWKAISTSDRFDNGTTRIIFGNDKAVKAIREHKTNPWPDGVIFAKTAWKQNVAPDGTVSVGAFIQVEYMIKDAKQYAATKGWGWARWKGNDLKPYGDGKGFEQECIRCHNPVKDNDYVFTTPLHLDVNNYKIYNQ